ncbi:MAG: hypothetical protein QXH96_01280, partial [Candidatus Geothermarchaeota archaeon]
MLAYKTTKYMPASQVASKDFVKDIFSGKIELSKKHVCLQLVDAIEFHNSINSKKYMYLFLVTL